MLWRHAVTIAVLIGAAGATPAAAQNAAPLTLTIEIREASWPTIVPRLNSYTDSQKAAITRVVEQYCTSHPVAVRAELQAEIKKLLMPNQIIEAVRHWLPQNADHDLRPLMDKQARPARDYDACDRPLRSIS